MGDSQVRGRCGSRRRRAVASFDDRPTDPVVSATPKKAVDMLSEASRLLPSYLWIRLQLARAHQAAGHGEEALELAASVEAWAHPGSPMSEESSELMSELKTSLRASTQQGAEVTPVTERSIQLDSFQGPASVACGGATIRVVHRPPHAGAAPLHPTECSKANCGSIDATIAALATRGARPDFPPGVRCARLPHCSPSAPWGQRQQLRWADVESQCDWNSSSDCLRNRGLLSVLRSASTLQNEAPESQRSARLSRIDFPPRDERQAVV